MWTLAENTLSSFEFSSIGIIGVLLLVIAIFALIGFVKGLAKTTLALINLGAAGFAAFWGYNHGPSWLSQYIHNLPDFTNIIIASFAGAIVFWVLFKIFNFLANPFQDSKAMEKCGFGLPAALICVPLAGILLFFVINRMRTTDELDSLKIMLTNGTAEVKERSGIHAFVMKKLEASEIGQMILDHDPLWESNKAKLVKLAIFYHQAGPNALRDNPEVTEILTDPDFLQSIMEQSDVTEALTNADPSALWESSSIEKALDDEQLQQRLDKLSFE